MGFDAIYRMGMTLIDEPCGTSGVYMVRIASYTIMLSISVTLAIMGTADDDGMGDVTTDEVDEHLLSMT